MNVILHSRAELKGDYKRLGFEIVAIKRGECGKNRGKNTSGCQTLGRVYTIISSFPHVAKPTQAKHSKHSS